MKNDHTKATEALNRLSHTAHEASRKATYLEDKLRFQRLEKEMQAARRLVVLHHFDNLDAAEVMKA